jgi:serine/threonine protein kinase
MDDVRLSQTTTYLIGKHLSNYRLIKQLGQGGFATVYLGRHRYLGTLAAIKVLDTQLTPYELGGFLREARITAQLKHRHIIRVLDFGKQDGIPFLVIEYAPYHTLRNLHPPGCRLTPGTVVSYARQVASALHYMHERGIIHQDVKPQNMLLGEEHQVLLSDFGISIVAHKTHAIDKREIVGSLPYMAPEQLRGEPCVASDQYALGVVVYEWLTGRLPFEGSRRDVMHGHLYERPPSLRSIVPTLSLAVERVVLKALAKAPEERFGSVREFAEALERAYRQPSTASRRPRSSRRKQQAHLREAAGLLGASLVIGSVLGLTLSALDLQLEIIWVFLTLCLLAAPLLGIFVLHNQVAFALTGGILVVSIFIGFVTHSLPAFLVSYGILSLMGALVAFSLGIQDGRKHSGTKKK